MTKTSHASKSHQLAGPQPEPQKNMVRVLRCQSESRNLTAFVEQHFYKNRVGKGAAWSASADAEVIDTETTQPPHEPEQHLHLHCRHDHEDIEAWAVECKSQAFRHNGNSSNHVLITSHSLLKDR